MDRDGWNARYAGQELVWSAEPNQFLVQEVAELTPGRALDVACGEGRNAIWLAGQGWRATGVDFSSAGLEKGRQIADQRDVTVEWVEADVTEWTPPEHGFDLVIIFYLQLAGEQRHRVYQRMVSGLAPGGTMLVVGHDAQNLTDGYGGPQDASVLFRVADVIDDLAGLHVVKAEQVRRAVQTDEGTRWAIDALVRAVRL